MPTCHRIHQIVTFNQSGYGRALIFLARLLQLRSAFLLAERGIDPVRAAESKDYQTRREKNALSRDESSPHGR
jgi:hypothetical protein